MDPITLISLLASLTGLIQASLSVAMVLNDVRNGENELLDLSMDVSVFAEALSGFERVLRSRFAIHRLSASVVKDLIENSTKTVKSLQDYLSQISSSDVLAVRRMRWMQHMSGIKKLHNRLKEQSAMLQTLLSITHAESFLAVASLYPQYMLHSSGAQEITVEDKHMVEYAHLQTLQLENDSRRSSRASSLATVESTKSLLDPVTAVSSTSSLSSFTTGSRRASEDSAASSLSIATPATQGLPSAVSRQPLLISPRTDEAPCQSDSRSPQPDTKDTLVIRQSCHYVCHCKCHMPDIAKFPRGLMKPRGFKMRCTEATCRGNVVSEEKYEMQSKSFYRTLCHMVSSKSIKVRYNLNTYRMVSEGSDAMRFVKHGNLDRLRECIESGQATIWDTAPDGWSLLHTAAYNRQLPIVKYLLDLGVDTDVADIGSRKPADLAILKSIGQDATEIEQDIVELFSQQDDCLIDFDFTPIHIAVLNMYDVADLERPSLKALIELLDDANNAPVSTNWAEWKSKYRGRSPLFAAILEYFRSSAYELPKGSKIIHNLLDRKDRKYSWTPLHWAASAGHVDKMNILVEQGADPSLLSNLNANILHAAAESMTDRGLAGVLDIWRCCPDKLDLNQRNRWNETPLHVAAWSSAACVRLLVAAGADTAMQQEDGQIPLHCAGLSGQGPDRLRRVVELCRGMGTEHINIQDVDGRPPIFDFLDDSDCVEMLVHRGANLHLVDGLGKTAFHHACLQDNSESLRTMLKLVINKRIATFKDLEGNTPLLEALSNSSVDCAMALLELEDVGDIISKDGWAAVHYAAKLGDAELLEAVFKHSSFKKGLRTPDGKRVDTVSMEAGTWAGAVKELVRRYEYIDQSDLSELRNAFAFP